MLEPKLYTPVDINGKLDADGGYVLFGTYPATIKTSDVTVSTTADSDGYYPGSDGAKYMKFTANPYSTSYTFSDGTTIVTGTAYYFKLEPIKWRILSESNGTALIFAESILDACWWDDETSFTPNYANSEVRAFLNGYSTTYGSSYLNNGLLQTAFTTDEQSIIQTTTVDNSASTTHSDTNSYACENTQDKLFLLSYKDLRNADYGVTTTTTRQKKGTDYAKANYLNVPAASSNMGNSPWWTRSPHTDEGYATCVRYTGGISRGVIDVGFYGVAPALNITL